MGYKSPPIVSIEAEGGIVVHINNFFRKRGLPHQYGDVLRLKNLKIGKRKISPQQAADELGIKSRNTVLKWWKLIDESSDHAQSQTDKYQSNL